MSIRSISTLNVSRGLSFTISVSYNTVGKDTEEENSFQLLQIYGSEVFHLVEITNLPPTSKFVFESIHCGLTLMSHFSMAMRCIRLKVSWSGLLKTYPRHIHRP